MEGDDGEMDENNGRIWQFIFKVYMHKGKKEPKKNKKKKKKKILHAWWCRQQMKQHLAINALDYLREKLMKVWSLIKSAARGWNSKRIRLGMPVDSLGLIYQSTYVYMFVSNLPIQSRASVGEHDATAWQWQNRREA